MSDTSKPITALNLARELVDLRERQSALPAADVAPARLRSLIELAESAVGDAR